MGVSYWPQPRVTGYGTSVEQVVFREQFTGDGVTTTFQLTGAVGNAVFVKGQWKAFNIRNTAPASVVRADNKQPVYDSTNVFTRTRVSIQSISPTGLVTMNVPPLSGRDIYVYYWYNLDPSDDIDDYIREEHVASMEADYSAIEATKQTRFDYQQTVFVGKHGDDANSGLSEEKAVLTLSQAITVANSLSPSDTNRIAIVVLDAGEYAGGVTVPQYVSIIGERATLTSGLIFVEDSTLVIRHIRMSSGVAIFKGSGLGDIFAYVEEFSLVGGAIGVLVLSGRVYLHSLRAVYDGSYFSLLANTTALYLRADTILSTGAGYAFGSFNGGEIYCYSDTINVTNCALVSNTGSLLSIRAKRISASGVLVNNSLGDIIFRYDTLVGGTVTNTGNIYTVSSDRAEGATGFEGNTSSTTFGAVGTFVKMVGTYVSAPGTDISASGGTLTYNGVLPKKVLITMTCLLSCVSNNNVGRAGIAINGTVGAGMSMQWAVNNALLDGQSPNVSAVVTLNNGDTVEAHVANDTSTSNVIVGTVRLQIKEV